MARKIEVGDYFSERGRGPAARDQEEIGAIFWGAFVGVVQTLVANGSLAQAFPVNCYDAPSPYSVDEGALARKFRAHVPGLDFPMDATTVPETLVALDAVEFFARHVSKPGSRVWHSFFRHEDLFDFDVGAGVAAFAEEVNTLFRRCGHPYELKEGPPPHVERIAPPVLQDVVASRFQAGDRDLDELLEVACTKFLSPEPRTRLDGLEKLWDAFERLKTLHSATNKKASMEKVLEAAVPEPHLRERVDAEARSLTDIGNDFRIRHHETGKVKIERDEHVDYLFHRLFALIWMILKGRRAVL